MDEKTAWGDGLNGEAVCRHFGYDPGSIETIPHGFWPNETVMERIQKIPECIKLEGADKKKFRIIIDYDPEFQRALVQFQIQREPAIG